MRPASIGMPKLESHGWSEGFSDHSIILKGQKERYASYHLVPFFLRFLGLKESEMTKAISKSIVDLDELAQQIDAVIDNKSNSVSDYFTFQNFKGLEIKIVDCFSYLSDSPQLHNLITDTLVHVNKSFKYNTVDRHLIYNLKNSDCNGCTTYYLFPLIKYLFSFSQHTLLNEHFLILTANYTQILDDFIDLFDDIKFNIKTPITVRLKQIERSFEFSRRKTAFEILAVEVIFCLNSYLSEIQIEAKRLNNNMPDYLFSEWNKFHKQLEMIQVPRSLSKEAQKKYLKIIHEITPPVICYVS